MQTFLEECLMAGLCYPNSLSASMDLHCPNA